MHLTSNSLVMPIKPIRSRHPDYMTRVALLVLAKIFYGLDVYSGLKHRELTGRAATLRALQKRGAIDKSLKITDEGTRLLVVHTQPKVYRFNENQ